MSNVIPEELTQFNKTVSKTLDSMFTSCDDLSDKLDIVLSSIKQAKSSFNSYYESKNKSTVLNKFNTLVKQEQSVDNNIESNLRPILEDSKKIVEDIKDLEEINKKIAEQENIINEENKKEEPSSSVISAAESIISAKNNEFKTKSEEALDILKKLKAKDQTFAEKEKETDYTDKLGQLKHGQLVKKKYKMSNGTVITCLVYIPDYGEEVEGLPINMYMHGSGMGENDVSRLTRSGLGRLINDHTITPSGIVVCPLAPSGKAYESKAFRDALAELPLKVADEYKADKNKISLSGHSYGAVTAYKLVNEHPNEFSAVVPISGSNKVTSAFKNVKVWAFHGTADDKTQNTSYKQAYNAMNQINANGGDAEIHAYEGWGHAGLGKKNIVISTFTNSFSKDGEKITPLEWAFKQSKNQKS